MTAAAASSVQYPEKFHLAERFVDATYGDLEQNTTLSTDSRLIFYALRQQANHGPCKDPPPWMWNVTERYKHSAWLGLGNMSKPEAMVHYTRHLDNMNKQWLDAALQKFPGVLQEAAEKDRLAAAEHEKKQREQDEQAERKKRANASSSSLHLGSDSIVLPSSPKRIDVMSVQSASSRTQADAGARSPALLPSIPVSLENSTASISSSSEVAFEAAHDIALLSDAHVAALLTATPDGRIPSGVARGLVNEVLRLRRMLVLSSSVSVVGGSRPIVTPQRVEHRYYGDGGGNQQQQERQQQQQQEQFQQTGGGWFSSWFGGASNNNRTAQV